MNILYVYAHPHSTSFNNVLKETGCEVLSELGHFLVLSDLYAQNFNAVASWDDFNLPENALNPQYFISQKIAYESQALTDDLKIEIEKILKADHIVFQFPLWWFSVPAILKGWLDRLLIKGFAYDSGKIFSEGLLKGKTASLVVTTQSPEEAYQTNGLHQCTIDAFLHPIHHTLKFVGIESLPPFIVYNAFDIDAPRKVEILDKYRIYLQHLILDRFR